VTAADWNLTEWWLPKRGNSVEEFEDAIANHPASGRFAVADGATESSFSGRWAQGLARAFARQPPPWPPEPAALAAWLKPLQQEWHAGIPWDRLPWYGLEKAQAGAFATLLGLEFLPDATGDPGGAWRAISVGDSALFQIREGELRLSWPVWASGQLGSRPRLLSSLPSRNAGVLEECVTVGSEARPGDRFLLMTDSPAKWFLEALEAGERPWELLLALPDGAAFEAWVEETRQAHTMRNDDVTLVMLTVPEQLPEPAEQPALPPPAASLGLKQGWTG
jgi:hypothetical protein